MKPLTRAVAALAIPAFVFGLAACTDNADSTKTPSPTTSSPTNHPAPDATTDDATKEGTADTDKDTDPVADDSTSGITVEGDVVIADVAKVGQWQDGSGTLTPIHVRPGQTLRLLIPIPANFIEEGNLGDCIEGRCPAFLGASKSSVDNTVGTVKYPEPEGGYGTMDGGIQTLEYPVTGTGTAQLVIVFDKRHDADQPNQPYDAAWLEVKVVSDK